MKKLLSLLVIALVLTGLSSCKKDKAETKVTLVAKWNFKKVISTTFTDGTQTEQTTDTVFNNRGAYAQFNANLTGRVNDKENDYLFTYTYTNNTITLANFDFNSDGVVDENEDDIATSIKVLKLTSTELVTRSEISFTLLGHTYKGVEESYFTK